MKILVDLPDNHALPAGRYLITTQGKQGKYHSTLIQNNKHLPVKPEWYSPYISISEEYVIIEKPE